MEPRRDFLKTATAAFTTNLFTGRVKGANDRVNVAFIGTGRMGLSNLSAAQRQGSVDAVAVCDIYQPNLEKAVAASKRGPKGEPDFRSAARSVADFRDIFRDKSIDAVCISTPDHWHPYMTVEACKAGKDVYVEKPVSVVVEEGRKMVEAARKYRRVVQVGTMQRSGIHFQKAADAVKSGKIGQVTFVRTWNYGNSKREGIGAPADTAPPSDLDWNMWLGPAPNRPYNANRFGVDPKAFSHFRWFWDYAGGMMTDWGVHVLDIARMGMNEVDPIAVTALGGKYWIQDNRETPDTLQVTYEFPGFVATYENRLFNANSMFNQGYGTIFHGTEGTLFVDRSVYRIIPERGSAIEAYEEKSSNNSNVAHWQNFVDCIKSREKPVCDIEIGHRSTVTALLGNVALRSKLRIDWDAAKETTAQAAARPYLRREYRAPWKLEV